ncbi:MAG: hypothetical protein IVW57_07935 [Ktedonobacterales bacterium]|nr:hypothetical protein [Ktedonobacterales bacterium]
MPVRYCTHCWAANAWDAGMCLQCGARLVAPDGGDLPYIEKLLEALAHPEPETRARAATILGVIGSSDDPRVVHALLTALQVDPADEKSHEIHDTGLEGAAARALGQLHACEAAAALERLALRDGRALASGLAAIAALTELAQYSCPEARASLARLTRDAGRETIRHEAALALGLLDVC